MNKAVRRPGPNGVPCPREVWRAAAKDRRINVSIQPEAGTGTVEFSGHITERRKTGSHVQTYVTVQFVPDGEVAMVEIEAGKDGGTWDVFRAFHWTRPEHPPRCGPHDCRFQYLGEVVALDIPEGRWNRGLPGDAAVSDGGSA